MTRVSLREAYDNKDVVAQIYAIRDTAESAVDTSEQAVTTANTASDHVDALVPQVEGAVANANTASASAQASAQTVAGYENRLGAVETGLSTAQHDITAVEDNVEDLSGDLNAVTLRVTTAEGQIVTIQGRVTALETADGQNIKINAINNYALGLTGNQLFSGIKTMVEFLRKRMSVNPGETHTADIQNFVQIMSMDRQTAYGYLYFKILEDDQTQWVIGVRNRDGTIKEVPLLTGD